MNMIAGAIGAITTMTTGDIIGVAVMDARAITPFRMASANRIAATDSR
jgi:hypothetical protein